MRFNNTELTQETILATRQHFIDNCNNCIRLCRQRDVEECSEWNEFFVNDKAKYISDEESMINYFQSGEGDHTFTFLQRAYWIQTGEMVALLPKVS